MRRIQVFSFATLFAVAAIIACGDSVSHSPEVQAIAGSWQFADSLLNWGGLSHRCTSGSGTLTITPAGDVFTGTLTDQTLCALPSDTTDTTRNYATRAGPIENGVVTSTAVSFSVAFCNYVGTLSGDPPNMMSGDERCVLHSETTTDSWELTADWQATR
jgi:hypothetical protein